MLYKTEDIVEMSIPALTNPEVRRVSNQPAFTVSDNFSLSHNANIDPLMDLPGYSLCFSPLAFAPLAYESPKKAIAVQKPLSPAPEKESSPPKATPKSPPSSRTMPVQLKIRNSYKQLQFDYERLAEPEPIIHEE